MIRAVIFDFDGVLVDSERLHYEALVHVLRAKGMDLSWEDFKKGCLGVPDRNAVRWALERNGVDDEEQVLEVLRLKTEVYDGWLAERVLISDEVVEVVKVLAQKFLLVIATGSFQYQVEAVLSRAGVRHLFSVIVGYGDYEKGKPDPTPFLLAMEKLNQSLSLPLKPSECIVLEDSPAGIRAAINAGMRCVAVRSYFDDEALKGADIVVDNLRELLLPRVWEHLGMPPLL